MKYQKCEYCGANIDIAKDGACPYYGTHYKVEKVEEPKIVNNENESNEKELLSEVFERKNKYPFTFIITFHISFNCCFVSYNSYSW